MIEICINELNKQFQIIGSYALGIMYQEMCEQKSAEYIDENVIDKTVKNYFKKSIKI